MLDSVVTGGSISSGNVGGEILLLSEHGFQFDVKDVYYERMDRSIYLMHH